MRKRRGEEKKRKDEKEGKNRINNRERRKLR
jgi:hypothetical protein